MKTGTKQLYRVLSRLEAKLDKYLRERELHTIYCDWYHAKRLGIKACVVKECIYEVKLGLGLVHPHKKIKHEIINSR